jgi:glycosyltransferase involved in cell wall biosynthesis
MKKLYYLGKPGDGFGWGIANTNLVRELSKLCNVEVDTTNRTKFDAPVFVPILDHTLKPLRRVKSPRTIGYCFTEWPLDSNAKIEAKQYDIIFSGSTWNKMRLAEHGIESEVLIQGVDFNRFKVQPPNERTGFVVFSGGKYEFRKGQDYVIAAMRRFMSKHSDVVLLTAWHNPWPQSMVSMGNSWLVDKSNPMDGLPIDRVIPLPAMPNEKTPSIYAQAHIGLFPNRCEAGTNMVMCEFMASGRPVIASNAHGHLDVLNDSQYLLKTGSIDNAGWFNPEVSDIITHLEHAYANREQLVARGDSARKLVERFTWEAAAYRVFSAAFPQ